MQDVETPQGETQNVEALGTEQQPATGPETQGSESKTDVQPVDSVDSKTETNQAPQTDAEKAQLQKELDKLRMELNMRRNKEKEEELKRLEDTDNYKELADRYRAELEEYQRRQEEQEAIEEARKFRDEVIASYSDDKTKEAAKRLLAENESALSWGNADTYEAARAEMNRQLDTLRDVVNPEQAQPEVDANNPAPQGAAPADRQAMIEEAAKKRNFSDVLKTIPSVAQQIEQLDN